MVSFSLVHIVNKHINAFCMHLERYYCLPNIYNLKLNDLVCYIHLISCIFLSSYPQRVSKLKASVRYMFHNPEDVRWFKPVEVWTKCGRRGRVKEPVGTHGAMKCIFNGVLQQHDTVCMSLYKRSYPKWPEHRFPILDV
uniref:Ribosome biogenesis protein BMS1/TSR1 C-terminal domain-containing protein n=1 Tax=Rhizophora mucronata TaxID=61149 RepID=A0A2P2M9D1_RHIMU